MAAFGYDAPIFQHHYFICLQHGGKPVGNHDHSAALGGSINGILHHLFAFGIQSAGGFVKDKYGWISDDGARYTQPLLLSAGKVCPLGIQYLVITVFKIEDKFFCMSYLGGFTDS